MLPPYLLASNTSLCLNSRFIQKLFVKAGTIDDELEFKSFIHSFHRET